MSQPIPIPRLIGGVSNLPISQRSANFVEEMDNTFIDPLWGFDKRSGTQIVMGDNDDGSLDMTSPTNDKQFIWMDRDDGEQFVIVIDPNLLDTSPAVIEAFNRDGEKVTVNYDTDDPRTYLTTGTIDPDQRIRGVSVADAMYLLNREVDTDLKGDQITYRANGDDLRKQTNDNNRPTWWDFPQPPTGTVPDGVIESDHLYYARQDEAGLPQGFYRAISTTAPPWYERLRTEQNNSEVDEATMPIRLDFDGTAFTASLADWKPRLSGDSLLNPAATFFGQKISDMIFFQNRLFFASGERIVASRAGDIQNFWLNSPSLITDQDYFDIGIAENRVSNIDHLIPYQNTLMMFTRADRQMELGASGPFSFNTVSLRPVGDYSSAPYVQPISMEDRLFFIAEKNFHNQLWSYMVDAETQAPRFDNFSAHADEYIPATARQVAVSSRHRKVFITTRAEPNMIYINDGGAWYRWIFDEGDEILSIHNFDNELYMIIRRNDMMWMERVFINQPVDDTIDVGGGLIRTMGYGVRLDRKITVQGVYDPETNTTSWTLPMEDDQIDTLVLGPTWDTGEPGDPVVIRLAGATFSPEVTTVEGQTVLTLEGQFQKNAEDADAPAYVGKNYTMRVRLSDQHVRDPEVGRALFGNTVLLSGRLRFIDTVYFRVVVNPHGPAPETHKEFIFPRAMSTPLDDEFVQPAGEIFFRILGRNSQVDIDIINDKPVPSMIVDGEINSKFIPQRKTPT